jgi:hypothetical protein
MRLAFVIVAKVSEKNALNNIVSASRANGFSTK